jgi:hypothetical protein
VFAEALDSVQQYTLPVIFSHRYTNRTVGSGCATFIVVNSAGWILTASHVIDAVSLADTHAAEMADYEAKRLAIANNPVLIRKAKERETAKLKLREKPWVTHSSILWFFPECVLTNVHVNKPADIAIGKLEPFDPKWVASYPTFKDPAESMPIGASLCRLGFPFSQIVATFDEKTQEFKLDEKALPIPRFPNDGIHTRVQQDFSADGTVSAKFIETSTPGLMGQSGGPIFDRRGHIWATQSRTNFLALGFAPEVIVNGQKHVEHQVMNLGVGSHVEEIIALFRQNNVTFKLSSDKPRD